MIFERGAANSILRGAVAIHPAIGDPFELSRLYARWVDVGDGQVILRASHSDGRRTLITHGIPVGERLGRDEAIELGPGQLSLAFAGAAHHLREGILRILDTDGWTYIRFEGEAVFHGAEGGFAIAFAGWYSDLSY